MPIETIIIEFQSDTSQLVKGENQIADSMKKVNTELSKQQQELGREQATLSKLTASLATLTGESKKSVESLIKLGGKEVVAGFDKLGLSVDDYLASLKQAGNETVKTTEKTRTAAQELKKMREELIRLERQGKANTKEFKDLQNEAGNLADTIADVGEGIKRVGSDTGTFDGLLNAAQGLAGGFAAVQGAAALFGDENEELQETLLKVNAAMALLQGLQQVQQVLQKDSAASILLTDIRLKALAATQTIYAAVVGASTGAMKAFRIALAATGVGLIVVAIGALITNFDKIKEVVGRFLPDLSKLGDAFNYVKNAVTDFLGITSQAERDLDDIYAAQLRKSAQEENQIKANIEFAKEKAEFDKKKAEERRRAEEAALAAEKARLEQQIAGLRLAQLEVDKESFAYRNLEVDIIRLTAKMENLTQVGNKALLTTAQAENEIAELTKGRIAEVEKSEKAFTESFKIEGQKKIDATDAINKAILTKTKIGLKDVTEVNRMSNQERVELSLQTAQQITGIFAEAFKQQTERELQKVDDQRSALKELEEAGAISAKEAEKRAKQLDDKERQIKIKAAQRDKAIAIFQATIATAQAVVKSLAVGLPQGAILAAIAGALGAAQIALIAARPIPKFAKGKKDHYEGFGIVGEAGAELIERNGRMEVATRPQLTWLNKSDKVYTAKETLAMTMGLPPSSNTPAKKAEKIDYEKIGQSIAKHIPQIGLDVDENGFKAWAKQGLDKTKYLDKRRKF